MSSTITQKAQAGIETTRGTDAAATRLIYPTVTPNFEKPVREFPDRSGTFDGRRRFAQARERTTFTISDLLTFEDLAWWMQLGLKGGVTGTGDAGSPQSYLYNFTPSLATDDLKSITLEWGDVAGPIYQSTQAMLNSWTIRIDPDNEGGWILDGEMLARDTTVLGSYTAALTDRTTEVIKAPTTKLWLDDATMGTTQVTDRFISASVTVNNNLHFKAFAEHEAAFAANKVGRGLRTWDAQITMEFDSDAEFLKFRSGTRRLMQIQSEGSTVHTTVKKQATVNLYGYWSTIGWTTREENIIATFGLMGFFDTTAQYTGRVQVRNALATLV